MNTTVNQTFNWSRFTATLRKEVVENWRAILFTLLGTYGLLTMLMILGNIAFYNANERELIDTMLPQKVVYAFLSIATIVVASLSFKKLTSKTGRTEMFTSPSSTLEKFIVNGVVYVLGYIIAFFILTQLADLTRFGALKVLGFHGFLPGPINFTNVVGDFTFGIGSEVLNTTWGKAYLWIGLLASPSVYVLGSVVWPRLSLLKTFAFIYAIEIGIFILAAIFFTICGNTETILKTVGLWVMNHIDQSMLIAAMVMVVQTVVSWGLAWYLFKRKDVISLKWWK